MCIDVGVFHSHPRDKKFYSTTFVRVGTPRAQEFVLILNTTPAKACRFSKPPTHLFFVVAQRPNNKFSNWACATPKDMIFFVVSRIIYITIVGCKITMSLLLDINPRFQHKMWSTQMKIYMFIPKMVANIPQCWC